jgi:hypothetical protein
MKQTFSFLSLFILLLSPVPLLSQGQKEPVLTNAVADLDAGALSIFGDNFGPSPQVFLGTDLGTLEELGVITFTNMSIQASLPPATPPGTYLLVVSTGPGNKNMFAMDVTLGAVGPEGPPGPPGVPNQNIITQGAPPFSTAVGVNALISNTTGGNNTAIGFRALQNNITGLNNTAVGVNALWTQTDGFFNTAVGTAALAGNILGGDNTAVGQIALANNTDGANNTAVGQRALQDNTASGNTAMGTRALQSNTTGSENIALGFEAGINATTGHNNIYIGNPGVAAESNIIRIGDGSIHTNAFIAGVSIVPPSSKRFKEDIHDMGETSTNLMRLRPVTFHYKKEYVAGDGRLQYGLIAEEVAEVYPELVMYDDQGRAKTVVYQQLSGMLLNELQKQHQQVQELTERLARLEQVLTAQQSLAAMTN